MRNGTAGRAQRPDGLSPAGLDRRHEELEIREITQVSADEALAR
jgi:hypothetical protein